MCACVFVYVDLPARLQLSSDVMRRDTNPILKFYSINLAIMTKTHLSSPSDSYIIGPKHMCVIMLKIEQSTFI